MFPTHVLYKRYCVIPCFLVPNELHQEEKRCFHLIFSLRDCNIGSTCLMKSYLNNGSTDGRGINMPMSLQKSLKKYFQSTPSLKRLRDPARKRLII